MNGPIHTLMSKGVKFQEKGEPDLAIVYYNRALKIYPNSVRVIKSIVSVYRQMGDIKAADTLQDKILELAECKLEVDPESVSTLSRVAIAHANVGNRNEALKTVEKITQLAPTDGLALYNCAATYAILGKKEEAFVNFEKALKMGFMNIVDWLPIDPYFKSVRSDPKYKKILEKYLT